MNRKKVKETVKAIMDSKTLTEAYKKTHNCTDATASKHQHELLKNPQVLAELEKQLDLVKPIEVNKNNILKMLTMIVQNWQQGEEKTADFLRAVELMSRLTPEFSDKHTVEHYSNMSDEELSKTLNERLKKMGLN